METTIKAVKNLFERKCYEAYKLRWMIAHGDTLKEMLDTVRDIAAESIEAGTMGTATDGNSTRMLLDKAQDIFSDVGFSGSLWTGFDEFLRTEFKDPYYMMDLINLMNNHEEMWEFYYDNYAFSKKKHHANNEHVENGKDVSSNAISPFKPACRD